jgi:D-alanyl-D-alanine carboxypeptidase
VKRFPRLATLALAMALSTSAWAAEPVMEDFGAYAESLLGQAYSTDGPGAAVLVVKGGRVLFRGAHGQGDVEKDVPLTADSTFQIASVTKQFAAAALLTLVDEGKVALGDSISEYLPGYPGGDAITIEQLLDHTSGIKNFTAIEGAMEGAVSRELTTQQLVDYFKQHAPDFEPGAGWKYNNSGYVLVGAVIEAVTHKPWHEYVEEALLDPHGLDDTGYAGDATIAASVVAGYTHVDGRPVAPSVRFNLTQAHAAGALASTVDDLADWNRALHDGRVLKPATYTRMITPKGRAKDGDYGFGIGRGSIRGQQVLEHSGRMYGYMSRLLYLPASQTTVIVLHNSDNPGDRGHPDTVARRLAAAAIGEPYPAVVPVDIDEDALGAYEGVYRVDAESSRTLRVVDGVLTAQRSGSEPLPLTPVGRDTFYYQGSFTYFTLERDDAGAFVAMRFFADGEGEGDLAPRVDKSAGARRL